MVNIKMVDRQAGLSLVELLVSLLIASFVLGGVVSVVFSNRSTYETEQEASFIQQNARYAVEMISRDMRSAGNLGCASTSDPDASRNADVANIVDGTLGGLLSREAITGYEGTTAVTSFPDVIDDVPAGSDAVIVRYADVDSAVAIGTHQHASQRFNLHSAASFSTGDKLVIVDANCRYASIFENTSTSTAAVNHAAGSGSPGNCDSRIYPGGDTFDCPSSGDWPDNVDFNPGSVLMNYVSNVYFIDDSNVISGMPSLKRRVLSGSGVRTEELAQGVESMELSYGVDSDSDGAPNAYMDADDIANWNQVVAIQVSLIFRSQSQILETARTITLNGVSYSDRYMRQIAATTVKIRNR